MFLILQKWKWEYLSKKNADYYIYSDIEEKDEEKYKESGFFDVKKLIINDLILSKNIIFKKSVALEIGCGNGRMTEFMSNIFNEIYAIDISKNMIIKGKKRLEKKNINFYENNGDNYPIKSNVVDLVFSYIVFQHFPTKKMVMHNLLEIKRVLKPSGIAKVQFRGNKAFGGNFRFLKWYYGVYFSEKELNALLIKMNFLPLKIYYSSHRELWAIFQKKNNY